MKRFSLFIIILILSFNVRDSTTIHQFQFFFSRHIRTCVWFLVGVVFQTHLEIDPSVSLLSVKVTSDLKAAE